MEILKRVFNDSRNSYNAKILETPEFLILNNQLYDKTTLLPVKFEVLDNNDITFTSNMFILRRYIYTNYRNTNRYFEQLVKCNNYGMVEDIKYPNRFYIVGQRLTCGGFLKIYEDNINKISQKHEIRLLKEFNNGEYGAWSVYRSLGGCGGTCSSANYYCGNFDIIHQEREYLIIKQNWPTGSGYSISGWGWGSAYSGNRSSCFKLNKSDLSTVSIHDEGNAWEDASYNYFYLEHNRMYDYIFINWHLNHYIIRFDSINNSTTTIYNNPETGCDITCNPVKLSDWYYYLVDEYKRKGSYGYQLCRMKIIHNNDITDTIEHEYIDIIGNHDLDIDDSSVMANITHPLIHELHTIEAQNGNNYIILVARSQPNGEWYSPQHKLAVIKINDDDTAEVKQVISFKSKPCRGVLQYCEELGQAEILVTLHSNSFEIWKFDLEQEKYINTFSKNGIFYALGIDEQQRIYTQDDRTEINMYDNCESSIAKVYFKENVINENDTTATLCFWTKDFLGNYTSEQVIINLFNGIVFEDDTIEKTFTSSDEGPTEIIVKVVTNENVKARASIVVASKQ